MISLAAPAEGRNGPRRGLVFLALAAVLAAGVVLRLLWLDDIEYKADEAWTWQHASAAGQSEPVPWVGMPTSAGPENPGMSLWVFMPLAWLSDSPVGMARGVAWLSIASIAVWLWFAFRLIPSGEREMWLWGAALSAVNPLSVLYHRKIWPNSVFPLLVSLFLICWYRRERRLSAFGWGVLGSVLTQINLSAGFFGLAFVVWAWFARTRVAWKSWFAGSVLASLPLLPWYHFIRTVSTQPRLSTLKLGRLLEFKFHTRWLIEPLGFGLDHALGNDLLDFLRQPVVGGVPTWLVAILHAAALVLGLAIGWNWFKKWRHEHPDWRAALFPANCFAALVSSTTFWGYGVLLTLTCLPIHRQYQIVAYPIEMLWVAYVALHLHRDDPRALSTGRKLLAGLVVIQLLLSFSFLSYVHGKRTIDGDYGVALSAQPAPHAPRAR